MESSARSGPLDGVTVLDLTRVLSGPYCTMQLADMGARVIKIEHPVTGDDTRSWGPPFLDDGQSVYFVSINRNKESVTLNFKDPEGRRILERLIQRTDVLVENFRPGALRRLDLDYATLSERYPRLIYCSISGFGHTGPRCTEAGYDAILQAEGGLMSVTGAADGPPFRLGVAVADIVSGMFAAQGVLLALLARERSGRGQAVDIGMLDSVAALLSYQASIYFATGTPPARMGNRHPSIVPYETFTAADGDFVLAVGNDDQWNRFCAVTGLEALADDVRFRTNRARVDHYHELRPALAERLRQEPRQCWIERLTAAGVPCGLVRDLDEVLSDPQLRVREMVAEVQDGTDGILRVLGVPVKLSDTPGAVHTAPPMLGQHTGSVLGDELGLSAEDLEALRVRGVV